MAPVARRNILQARLNQFARPHVLRYFACRSRRLRRSAHSVTLLPRHGSVGDWNPVGISGTSSRAVALPLMGEPEDAYPQLACPHQAAAAYVPDTDQGHCTRR